VARQAINTDNKMIEKTPPLTIKVMYDDGLEELKQIEVGNWVDLKSAITKIYTNMEYFELPLGVRMELPDGYEAHVVPRSSTFRKYGVIQTNSMGIIDNSYCGDDDIWKMPCLAIKAGKIEKGDRVCQFRILPIMGEVELKTVKTLGNKNRGGLGSTGVK
jgi:dUTP pyrophosphatase